MSYSPGGLISLHRRKKKNMKSLKHLTTFSVVIFALFVGPIITLGQARAGNPSASAGGTDKVASDQKMAVKAAKTIPASTAP